MSHLGMKILYGLYNSVDYCWCERCFAPWPDMEAELRAARLPLYALESGDVPLKAKEAAKGKMLDQSAISSNND